MGWARATLGAGLPAGRSAPNENCTGLAQIVGQLQGSNRNFQSKCWAKSRNLGQFCTIFVWGVLAVLWVAERLRATSLSRKKAPDRINIIIYRSSWAEQLGRAWEAHPNARPFSQCQLGHPSRANVLYDSRRLHHSCRQARGRRVARLGSGCRLRG